MEKVRILIAKSGVKTSFPSHMLCNQNNNELNSLVFLFHHWVCISVPLPQIIKCGGKGCFGKDQALEYSCPSQISSSSIVFHWNFAFHWSFKVSAFSDLKQFKTILCTAPSLPHSHILPYSLIHFICYEICHSVVWASGKDSRHVDILRLLDTQPFKKLIRERERQGEW